MLAAVQGCMHELQMPHVKFVPVTNLMALMGLSGGRQLT